MPCFSPMVGVRSTVRNESGKYSVRVFPRASAIGLVPSPTSLSLPCGQCIGCRLERSRQWAIRCVHEASLYERNCWVTLTYSDKFLPHSSSGRVTLFKRDVQLFIKRLRRKFGKGVRYFYCGEYGDQLGRPHYHLCLFNFDFMDKTPSQVSPGGFQYYDSADLASLWSHPVTGESYGFTALTDLTFESAAYTARYITKKLLGKRKSEYGDVCPEYVDMSRRPGIGRGWFDKWSSDVYPSDEVCLLRPNGVVTVRPPRFYDRVLEKVDPSQFEKIKFKRITSGVDMWNFRARSSDTVSEFIGGLRDVLSAASKFHKVNSMKQLKRRFENDS